MKKSLRFLLASTLVASGVLAQPTLTATGCNPVVSDAITITMQSSGVSQGNAGANQTWNLTSISGTPSSYTYVAASSTTYSASFPGSTLAAPSGGNTSYFKTSSTSWQLYGVQQGTVTLSYSDKEDMMHYPFTYGNNYVDTWASTFVNGGTTYYRTGHDTVTADGYGTLTTPAGTFNNVLRVHFIQHYQDSTNFGGFPYIIPYRNDEYFWYLNGNHAQIAYTYTFTTTGLTQGVSGYMNNVVVGVEESPTDIMSATLFPNPASNLLHLNLNLYESQSVEVKVMNAVGSDVSGNLSRTGFAGANQFDLDVSTLPEGIYVAEIKLDGRIAGSRRFVISR